MSDEPDHENPEWTEADFARADPAERLSADWLAVFPKTAERLSRRSIGAALAAQAPGARLVMIAA